MRITFQTLLCVSFLVGCTSASAVNSLAEAIVDPSKGDNLDFIVTQNYAPSVFEAEMKGITIDEPKNAAEAKVAVVVPAAIRANMDIFHQTHDQGKFQKGMVDDLDGLDPITEEMKAVLAVASQLAKAHGVVSGTGKKFVDELFNELAKVPEGALKTKLTKMIHKVLATCNDDQITEFYTSNVAGFNSADIKRAHLEWNAEIFVNKIPIEEVPQITEKVQKLVTAMEKSVKGQTWDQVPVNYLMDMAYVKNRGDTKGEALALVAAVIDRLKFPQGGDYHSVYPSLIEYYRDLKKAVINAKDVDPLIKGEDLKNIIKQADEMVTQHEQSQAEQWAVEGKQETQKSLAELATKKETLSKVDRKTIVGLAKEASATSDKERTQIKRMAYRTPISLIHDYYGCMTDDAVKQNGGCFLYLCSACQMESPAKDVVCAHCIDKIEQPLDSMPGTAQEKRMLYKVYKTELAKMRDTANFMADFVTKFTAAEKEELL